MVVIISGDRFVIDSYLPCKVRIAEFQILYIYLFGNFKGRRVLLIKLAQFIFG